MSEVVVGGELLASGALTRGQLRWNYRRLFPDVYAPKASPPTLRLKTAGAWLWSKRTGVVTGRAASAMHGALWVREVGGLLVTAPHRTAFDLARHLPRDGAVTHLDALAQATGVTAAEALSLAARYPRARGLRRARIALDLMDGGAESPKETWLRLLLIDAGLPRPRTQIRVADRFREAFIDMGYDEPKVGLDYEGAHHSTDRGQYVHDIGRAELIEGERWIDVKVVKEHSRQFILHRVREAFARRGCTPQTLH
ncbi:hypothetical protein NIIDNTM18_41830 [Mycolicibacterium litorale]|uniref:Cullin, a subunit of E3 ubiquitin ligase n=1 Tax=Mycolicibacterium litorale TaxID=758802 RepID=A0A6S6P8R1_9MYCO|nr:hypothetical protein [Mycolicibacterium litorale]BCI54905.1 hypothetical protein NIIDNTM18_41830 [Mycolicibacterium litorale]